MFPYFLMSRRLCWLHWIIDIGILHRRAFPLHIELALYRRANGMPKSSGDSIINLSGNAGGNELRIIC